MPLFLCDAFWLFPPQHLTFWVIQQVLSKRNSIEVIVVNGMFLQSCRIKYWAKFVIDSILLIDTFFVLFRSSRGRYAGLIVPEDLFCKRVFQTSFLCQLVIKSLRNDVMSPIFFWRRFHMRRMLGIAKACKSCRQEIHPQGNQMLPFHFLSCIVLPNIFLRCLRLKTLNDFLPCPCSFAVPCCQV